VVLSKIVNVLCYAYCGTWNHRTIVRDEGHESLPKYTIMAYMHLFASLTWKKVQSINLLIRLKLNNARAFDALSYYKHVLIIILLKKTTTRRIQK
jgi:hypothetical protein